MIMKLLIWNEQTTLTVNEGIGMISALLISHVHNGYMVITHYEIIYVGIR